MATVRDTISVQLTVAEYCNIEFMLCCYLDDKEARLKKLAKSGGDTSYATELLAKERAILEAKFNSKKFLGAEL
jgi:hypothetical protein